MAKQQTKIFTFKDITIFEPNEILTKEGRPFRVFTPYAKAWHQQEKPSVSPKIRTVAHTFDHCQPSASDVGVLDFDLPRETSWSLAKKWLKYDCQTS